MNTSTKKHPMKKNPIALLALTLLFSCQGPQPSQSEDAAIQPEAEEAHAHDHADHATGASMDPSSEYMQVPDSAYVEFLNLADGDSVDSPFRVEMGAVGMEVRPAGEMVVGTGHHHLLVDMDAMEAGALIPNDETHLHFGLGQTETDVELSSGTHRLTMQFANSGHFSYGVGMSSSITLHVR
jgi:hypothetical protein